MTRMIFVNLPVQDLDRSLAFFTGLGFQQDKRFSDDKAACIVVNEQACVMLLTEPFFAGFTTRAVADTASHVEAILAVSADSRQDVDTLADTALASGGSPAARAQDHGFMYGRSFHDPDGHLWEVIWMDPEAAA